MTDEIHPALPDFLDSLAVRSPTDRVDLVAGACAEGHGTWIGPDTARPGHAPPTHQHEIALFGVWSGGQDPAQAVAHWITAASRLVEALRGAAA